jgi:hypothetical protein
MVQFLVKVHILLAWCIAAQAGLFKMVVCSRFLRAGHWLDVETAGTCEFKGWNTVRCSKKIKRAVTWFQVRGFQA